MKKLPLTLIYMLIGQVAIAQSQGKVSVVGNFRQWKEQMLDDYQNFRKKMLHDYADFLRNPWEESQCEPPMPFPPKREEDVTPPVVPIEDKVQPKEDSPIVIEEIVKPVTVEPQPEPISPIEEVPMQEEEKKTFTFFGTKEEVRFTNEMKFNLKGLSENKVADAIEVLSEEKYDNLIKDCLSIRKSRKLCDWAYLHMLKAVTSELMGNGSNEATLLMAYIYMQSGYRMRLAHDGHRLYMLYACKHKIYNAVAYEIDGLLYYGIETLPDRLSICRAAFPKEKSMSLYIADVPELDYVPTPPSVHKSNCDRDIEISFSANKNALDFYTSYPSSEIGENFITRWAMYANMPMPEKVQEQVYPKLKTCIDGADQLTAVNRLLNWVQTGFAYEFDYTVWGHDRAFFPEESLHYPYCDCEDRSILLTRIVRDLLGLKCLLVYYPGHLASAIAFTDGMPKGDFIEYQGTKYYIADGTILGAGAPVGYTMPEMDNTSAKVILLK